jgi:hypothetical protein
LKILKRHSDEHEFGELVNTARVGKKMWGKKMEKCLFPFWTGFYFFNPGSLKTLNRLCSNNSVFQEDRGVSEGFSGELARDRTWCGQGTSILQDYL